MTAYVRCRSIIMVGTHPTTMGGISTVVRGYLQAGLFERFKCTYVSTHRDGTGFQKALTALWAYVRIFSCLLKDDAPLVHIHLSSRASFWRKSIVCQMARLFRRPYLLHVHGSEFMRFYEDECGVRAQRFIRSLFEHATLVFALSEQWRDNLLKVSPRSIVEILANAVPLPDLSITTSRGPVAQEVLFVGRLGQRKGVFDLLQAFALIAPDFPSVRLICAGDGEIDEVRRIADRLAIGDRVDCLGWLTARDTQLRFASADVFVLPSYAEGMPMAMLEAMSWGLPVISTPVGGIPQVISSGANGLLVTPGNTGQLAEALSRLLKDPISRVHLGLAARKTIEQSFALDAEIERLSAIYRLFGIP